MARIGVFVCHCGLNIAGVVDVKKVAEELIKEKDVVYATTYTYMCSDPGQNLIREKIKEHKLDGVVIAACSPSMHEETFRNATRDLINPYKVEIANIREQCSWVHESKDATEKAIKITKALVEKVRGNDELEPIKIDVKKKALVIGGGIAGIQASLDIADAGYEVILVEKEPSIGGRMAQLSETFPTLDCSQCILTPKMVLAARHPNIKLLTYSEVTGIDGYVGNFKVTIKKKPRYIDVDKCTACGDCEDACIVVVPNEFDFGRKPRKAIYIPFPQAVPAAYVIDEQSCLGVAPLRCGECAKVCEANAIDYDMQPEYIEEKVGAIVVATGYDLYDKNNLVEYGYGEDPDIITSLEFERMLSAGGPTQGKIIKPSNGKEAKKIVFIQCAGSRDKNHKPYCSSICCMYTAKHALLFKHHVEDGEAYVFYIDIRATGKNYEEFIARVMEEERINYIRGKPAKIYRQGDKIIVEGVDTLLGKSVKIEADLVVLALAVVPSQDAKKLARLLKVATDEHGFFKEAHPKLRPVEAVTRGIFFTGCCQSPKDIPSSVAQASAAASKVIAMFSHDKLEKEPIVAVFGDACTGCRTCFYICPFNAIQLDSKGKAYNIEALCEGCGVCVAACPVGNIRLPNFDDEQIKKMVEVILQ